MPFRYGENEDEKTDAKAVVKLLITLIISNIVLIAAIVWLSIVS